MNELVVLGNQIVAGYEFTAIEGGFGESKKCMLVRDIAKIHSREVRSINQTIDRNIDRFVVGKDIINILDMENSKTVVSDLEITVSNRAKSEYLLSERGYAKLLNIMEIYDHSFVKQLYDQYFQSDVDLLIDLFSRKENVFICILEKALNELNIKGIRQYNVDNKYRIDFYIPSKNIAVEYDEKEHKYHEKEDIERENYIKDKLDCKFIRCDYKDDDIINVMKVVKSILGIDLNDIYIEGGNR